MSNREVMQQALEALETKGEHHPRVYAAITALRTALKQPEQEPVAMRMPKVGDKVICLEDESLGKVVSLTAGGSPDITFDDGSRGTYLLSEFAELFGYVAPSAAEPPAEWELIKNILAEYGLDAIAFVAEWKAAQRPWQGLTDEDLKLLSAEWRIVYGAWMDDFAKDIEAKLKERNGY